ncbi:MAG: TetR/AcrR family transcriptional regulator [bacterium]
MKTKSAAKRLAILMAALGVVSEKGYFKTRVDDVARRAGVAKGTVYIYFKDKPAIYIGLLGWLVERALAATTAVAARPVSPGRKLDELFSTLASGLTSNPGVLALLSPDNIHQDDTVLKRFRKQVLPEMMKLEGAIADIVKQGIELGEFRRIDPRAAAMMYLSVFRAESLAQGRSQVTRPGDALKEVFFRGILAEGRSRPGQLSDKES